jgi:cytoskeletal protein RodZ
MPRPYIPGGYGFFGTIFVDVLAGLVFLIGFLIVAGLIAVLVRFLLVATKAAQLYLDNNSSPKDASATPVEPVATAPVPPAPPAPPAPTTAKTPSAPTVAASADTLPTVPVATSPLPKSRSSKKN